MIFYSSKEVREFGAPILRLLVTALGRVPGNADLAPLVSRFRSGASLTELALSVVLSGEFLARHGPSGPADQHYMRALYWAVDGKDPPEEAAGVPATPGVTRESLLLEVSSSARARRGIDLLGNLYPDGPSPQDDIAYQLWLEAYPQDPKELEAAVKNAAMLPPFLFTVFLRVSAIRPDLVEETITSLRAQLWPHWECVMLCADVPAHVRAVVEGLAERVAGIRIVTMLDTAELAQTVNGALGQSRATMFAVIEAGDRLATNALAEVACLLAAQPDSVLIYTDEDRIGGGERRDPSYKPDFSLDLLFAGDCLGQLALYSRDATLLVGGLAAHADAFIQYDLALRLAHHATPKEIRHIPKILFHRGRLKRSVQHKFPAQRATPNSGGPNSGGMHDVVARHLQSYYPALSLGERRQGNSYWPTVIAAVPQQAPCISVIIPIRDRPELLQRCLDGLMDATDYPDIEILIVDNGSVESATLQLLQRVRHDPRVRVLTRPGKFNWSALNNHAAATAKGEILLFLNNDIEVVEPEWLSIIAGHVMRPDIGVVGARLIFPDGGLQHGGILLGPRGKAVHAYTHSKDTGGYLGQVSLGRDLSAVTGACFAIRAGVFTQIGGFQERLEVTWGDVDLCLRVREAGYRVLWVPAAVLVHHEMATRGTDVPLPAQIRHEQERAIARRRSFVSMDHDPFLNPNLEATATAILLASPPRKAVDAPRMETADE